MEIKCTDKKTFQLVDNGQFAGQLIYDNLFSYKAKIILKNSDCYEIETVGFFGTSITITKDGQEIANLKMNWKGQIVISFQDEREFVFKAQGTFLNKYFIENKEEEKLIQFTPNFNWSMFTYSYDISYDKKPEDILVVLLGVYAANYFIAVMSGAIVA
jgi:hypothetical protein